jgi:type IV pilus assembly protein PilB
VQPSQPLTGLAKRLVNDGVFSAEVASDAVKQARDNNQSFIGYITQQGLVSGYRAAAAAAEEFGIPLLDIDAYDLNSLPQGLIKDSLISKHSALPLKRRDNKLFVAISDPTNIQALDEFKFQCGLSTEAVIVEQDKLLRTIDAFLDTQDKSLEGLEDSDLDNLELEDTEASQDEDEGNRSIC